MVFQGRGQPRMFNELVDGEIAFLGKPRTDFRAQRLKSGRQARYFDRIGRSACSAARISTIVVVIELR